jgi:GH24 family phage-related lysozyme (muramidase)
MAENVDFNFIKEQEGFKTTGYVPVDKDGKVLGSSGVTVASGFDLGQRGINDLQGLPKELVKKLGPFVGLQGSKALNNANKLVLTNEEALTVNKFAKKQELGRLSKKWKAETGTDFSSLPKEQATAIASVAFQYGDLETKAPNFWNQVTTGNWDGAKKNLANFGDKYDSRRKRELEYLNQYKEQGKAPGVNSYEQYMQAAENENAALMPTYGAPKVAAAPAVSPNFNVAGGYNPNKVAEGLPTLKPREVITETETITEEGPGFIDRIKSGFEELYPFNEGGAVNNTYTTNYTPGGTVNQAQGLASLGRGGDSTLVHMQPQEVAGLQQLAQANGTSLTRNPMTGYPEAFSLGGMFKAALPIAAGYFTGGAATPFLGAGTAASSAITAGALTGASVAAATGDDPIMGAVSGGMGGMSGSGLNTALMGPSTATGMAGTSSIANPLAGATPIQTASNIGTAMPGYSFPQTQTSTVGVSGLETGGGALPDGTIPQTDVVKQIKSGGSGSIGMPRQGAVDFSGSFSDGIDQVYRNLGTVDPTTGLIKNAGPMEVAKTLGSPVASLGLGGLEESDFINTPDFDDPRDKYNPYSKLNLSNDTGISEAMSRDTGLRLLAKGGYLQGPGDGMSDDIPATINGDEPAALADGEFVIPADVVSHLGNGSSEAGSKQLYAMMDRIRKARTGRESQGKEIKPGKYMPR